MVYYVDQLAAATLKIRLPQCFTSGGWGIGRGTEPTELAVQTDAPHARANCQLGAADRPPAAARAAPLPTDRCFHGRGAARRAARVLRRQPTSGDVRELRCLHTWRSVLAGGRQRPVLSVPRMDRPAMFYFRRRLVSRLSALARADGIECLLKVSYADVRGAAGIWLIPTPS